MYCATLNEGGILNEKGNGSGSNGDTSNWYSNRMWSSWSGKADNFNVTRKLTAFNQRTGDIVFIAVGNFSLQKESDGDLVIIGEDEDGGFYKHFVYLSSEIGYTCEQLKVSDVSKYKFTINYNPKYTFPVDFDYID